MEVAHDIRLPRPVSKFITDSLALKFIFMRNVAPPLYTRTLGFSVSYMYDNCTVASELLNEDVVKKLIRHKA